MKKVNFAVAVTLLSGKEARETNEDGSKGDVVMLNKIIANTLDSSKPLRDAIRQRNVAMAIWSADGAINLEDADFEMVKSVLQNSGLTTAVRAQAEEAIKAAVEVKKEKD